MYKNEYRKMFVSEDCHWWYVSKRNFISAVIGKTHDKLKILDVGSGTGGTTKFLGRFGNVISIEKSRYACQYLKVRGIKFNNVSITSYKINPNTYDMICLIDVLYHKEIGNVPAVLQNIKNGLKHNGLVVITDCAAPSLTSKHDILMKARQRYTLKEMESLVTQAGFKIVKSSYIFFFTFPLFVLQRTLSKFISIDTTSPPPAILNSILVMIGKIEAILLKRLNFPFGSSIIVLAKKCVVK